MEKEEILEKSQKENKSEDLADLEAQKKVSWVGFFVMVGACALIAILEGFLRHAFDYEVFFVLFAFETALFITKFVKLRKTHELIVSLLFGLLAIGMLTLSLLQIAGVI